MAGQGKMTIAAGGAGGAGEMATVTGGAGRARGMIGKMAGERAGITQWLQVLTALSKDHRIQV